MAKKAPRQPRRINKLLIGIAVAAIVILVLALFNYIQTRRDAHRFVEADRVKQAVFDDVIKELGAIPTHTEEKDVCYNSEHGPWDNGRLWCQVASIAYYSEQIEESAMEGSYKNALRQNGLSGAIAQPGKTVFYVRDLPCTLETSVGTMAVEPAYYFSKNNSAKQALIVRCATRAKAAHYPYYY